MSLNDLIEKLDKLEAEFAREKSTDPQIALLQEIGKICRIIECKKRNSVRSRVAEHNMGYSLPSKVNNKYTGAWRT
jgi:hypothetical protein